LTSTSLDEAMDRYASGDDGAFELVHAGLRTRLRAFLVRLCGSPVLADDLLQETFLRIHRGRGSFAPGAAALPWAYAVARNVWLEQLRSDKAHTDLRGPSLDTPGQADDLPTGPEADSEEALMAKETAVGIERALASLSRPQREAFVLLRYEGLSLRGAAAARPILPRVASRAQAWRKVMRHARTSRWCGATRNLGSQTSARKCHRFSLISAIA
jgi:RNA polymerase sigma-70 factor (ECF subfamily)